jgi:hypothetical protein
MSVLSTASIAGKMGTEATASTHTYTNVLQANFDFQNNLVTIRNLGNNNPQPIALTGSNTITLTASGGLYTLTIT